MAARWVWERMEEELRRVAAVAAMKEEEKKEEARRRRMEAVEMGYCSIEDQEIFLVNLLILF
jgi:hypothetical protein